MKKTLCLLLAVLTLAAVLTACKGNTPTGDNSTPGTSSTDPSDTSSPGNSQIGDNGMDDTDLSALIAALPDKEALKEINAIFSGYWTSGDLFVGFVYIDGVPGIDYGLFETSYGARGKITDARAVSAHEAELSVFIPANPATEMDDTTPERTDIIYIDISNYNDNRLNVKTPNLGGGEWHTYEYGGGSLDDANNNR